MHQATSARSHSTTTSRHSTARRKQQPSTDRASSSLRGADRAKLRCRAVFLDAGGVIALPNRELVRAALTRAGVEIDPARVAAAHYRAVRSLDAPPRGSRRPAYLPELCRALRLPAAQLQGALAVLSELADRSRSGQILWSEPAPFALETIERLGRAGIAVVIVTNSDGHAAENLRDAGICQVSGGAGASVDAVIDSAIVGSEKPDGGIFRSALEQVGADPAAVVHVGDTLSADVAGARAAGITPIHLDPTRYCRARDHRHIRNLKGLWSHLAP